MPVPLDYERPYCDAIPSVVSIYVGRAAPGVGAGSGFVYDAAASSPGVDSTGGPRNDGAETPPGRSPDATSDDWGGGYVVTNEHVVRDVTEVELRFSDGLDEPRGVLVVDVADGPVGGDALRGCDRTEVVRGQRVPVGGDVIVGIGGRELRTHEGLIRYLIAETRPGEPVEIDAIRDGRPVTLRVELGERPDTDEGDGRAIRVE